MKPIEISMLRGLPQSFGCDWGIEDIKIGYSGGHEYIERISYRDGCDNVLTFAVDNEATASVDIGVMNGDNMRELSIWSQCELIEITYIVTRLLAICEDSLDRWQNDIDAEKLAEAKRK